MLDNCNASLYDEYILNIGGHQMATIEYTALIDTARYMRLAADKLDSFLDGDFAKNHPHYDRLVLSLIHI